MKLVELGFVEYEGQRYEDFLPVSAAGIFASNLQQYGTKSTAHVRPTYSQAQLEEILGKRIIDSLLLIHLIPFRTTSPVLTRYVSDE